MEEQDTPEASVISRTKVKPKGVKKGVAKKASAKTAVKKKGGGSKKTNSSAMHYRAFLERAKREFLAEWNQPGHNTARLSDFEIIRTLGRGKYGRVMFARVIKSPQKKFVAIKILERQKVISMKRVEHVIREKKILMAVNFPFLVRGRASFKDNANLYYILDYVPGGEMFSNLQKQGKYPESRAKFYAAQVVMAFEYLHELGIVYRDLKPENLLIDLTGYLKITDFCFAKKIDDKTTMTMCGTPEYLAPEVIKNVGYSYTCDWWAVGILIYEMNTGRPPFASEDPIQTFEKIMNARIKYPPWFNVELRDIVRQLLLPDWTKRIGTATGIDAIKNHEWFQEIDWVRLFLKKIPAPFLPVVRSDDDTSNFDKYEEVPILELPDEVYAQEFAEF